MCFLSGPTLAVTHTNRVRYTSGKSRIVAIHCRRRRDAMAVPSAPFGQATRRYASYAGSIIVYNSSANCESQSF